VADAAHAILTHDRRSYMGNFAIDEDLLRETEGTDFERYAVEPGQPLHPDLFLGETPAETAFRPQRSSDVALSPSDRILALSWWCPLNPGKARGRG
jgi:hypothetical protein